MLFLDNVRFGLSAIWSNKLRTTLTMLGIIIGVFSVIVLVSIGDGVQKEFSGAVGDLGANVGAVISGDIGENEEGEISAFGGGPSPTSFATLSSLTLNDVESMGTVPGLSFAAPIMLVPGTATPEGGEPHQPIIIASTQDIFPLLDIKTDQGRQMTIEDIDSSGLVVMIGANVADELYGGRVEAIGKKVAILEAELTIIGVMTVESELLGGGDDSESSFITSSLPDLHDSYILPITTTEELLETLNIFRIMYKFEKTEDVAPGVEIIEERLLENHKGIKDFSVVTTDDLLNLFDEFFGILTNAIAGIAAISLLVGGIGIMNIMLVSVTERTREIGIRKAVGASNESILFQFLIESATVSLVGGAIGFLSAVIVSKFITAQFDIPTDISLFSILLSLGMSVGIGVVFGLAPATKAARKNPIDALRYE